MRRVFWNAFGWVYESAERRFAELPSESRCCVSFISVNLSLD